jgi:DNA repair exonuclease SbcCD ATPase subunit
MSTNDVPSKDDFLRQIWSISTTLTEEALGRAMDKAKESGFDLDRGIIPLRESFINLSSARFILEDAIEKQKLVQLPITVQKELLSNLQAISRSLLGLTDGVDEIVNLTNGIEILNAAIWKYGLHNLSDQVLGYQKKLNHIKNLEVQLSKATTELEATQTAAERSIANASEIEQKKTEVLALLGQIQQHSTASIELLDQLKDTEAKASTLHLAIQQQEKQSGELTSGIKTSNNELLALDASIRKFYGEVEEHRNKINQTNEEAASLIRNSEASVKKLIEDTTTSVNTTVEALQETQRTLTEELTERINGEASESKEAISKVSANAHSEIADLRTTLESTQQLSLEEVGSSCSKLVADTTTKIGELEEKLNARAVETIEANRERTDQLLEELSKLKEQIREQIQQATGFRLFGAFQSRQNEILKGKNGWAWAIAALVLISAGVTVWIAHEAQSYNVNSFAFYVKLSLTIPLAFAITFCTVQYSRERMLEEEYAFKSSISVSLNPYRDLIHSILEKDHVVDQTKYADFIIDTVRNVFTPPTDKVFDASKKSNLTEKTFKKTAEIIGAGIKAAK